MPTTNPTSILAAFRARPDEDEGHVARCQDLTARLAARMGLGEDDTSALALLASYHDIGKAAMPDSILMKPGRLTPEEWGVVRRHPEVGCKIAKASEELAHIAEAILSHHERWDGSGYPSGLEGEAIPLLSRIFSVVDAYDVMTHGTIYQDPMSPREALKVLGACAGWQFDPAIVAQFELVLCEA